MDWLTAFLASEAGLAFQALVVAAMLDFIFGVLAAARDGSFEWQALGAWIRKHLAGRVAPVAVLLLVTYATGNFAILAVAIAAASTYAVETTASLIDSLGTIRNPERPPEAPAVGDTIEGELLVGVRNPVPTD